MRILLINPPNCGRSIPEEEYGIATIKAIFRGEPLSLETLAAECDGHEVDILDLKVEPEALGDRLRNFAPDLVGITGMTCEANGMLAIAGQAKNLGVRHVVVGGHHASNDPEYFNKPGVDWVSIGLGSAGFSRLVQALERGEQPEIPWMARVREPGRALEWRRRPFSQEDLGEGRPPRYDLVNKYRDHYVMAGTKARIGFVVSAMGCTHACSFCAIPNLTSGRYLVRSPEAVARDIESLDTPYVRLVDANTFGRPEQAALLCRELAEKGLRRKYLVDVRADTVVNQPGLMKEWKAAGLAAAIIGLEEIDDERLRRMNKRSSTEQNRKAIAILKDIGVMVVGDFIVNPDYSAEDFSRLDDYIRETGVDLPIPSILTPMPGTALHRQMRDRITNHNLDYYTFSNAVVPTRMPEPEFYGAYAALVHRAHAHLRKP
ncbi:MAG: radical SAM protein [Opitutaceae bacterium]|jgi:radical SAM superfamily enzyme YgiQ (UPF0313 family)